jgi:hypothetical protein
VKVLVLVLVLLVLLGLVMLLGAGVVADRYFVQVQVSTVTPGRD